MSVPAPSLELRPKLAPKAKLRLDAKTGKYILLYPEKGLLLNPTGAAILKKCTGDQSISAIVAQLALEFQGDEAALRSEVMSFVQALLERGLLQAGP